MRFVSHTDFKDLKDCYAASGYALASALYLRVHLPWMSFVLCKVCLIGEADIF